MDSYIYGQMSADPTRGEPQFDQIRALPFVRKLRLIPGKSGDRSSSCVLEITTPRGKHRLPLMVKRSFLDRSTVNAVISQIQGERKAAEDGGQSPRNGETLLLAPYLAVPTAKSFIDAGISFADEAGNIHLALGDEYNWTVIGERKPPKPPESERMTPAAVQLLFQFATNPESANWTVRDLSAAIGLSKSKVAELRVQFAHEGIYAAHEGEKSPAVTRELRDRLISGYNQILRPKLVLGRYRYQESSVDQFVARLSHEGAAQKIPYALTGGPAADAMQHFYRSSELPVFLALEHHRGLRLLPDRTGPVVLLKPIGNLVYWREFDGKMVAPPWLVYAELLTGTDPRAREAAEELRREFLR
jgi:hypothetical protein